jgi:hypothetical protein
MKAKMKAVICFLIMIAAVFPSNTKATIFVVSDTRSIHASGSIDTNMLRTRYAIDPNPSITYSGGHSVSQVNTAGSSEFNSSVNGSESATVQYHPSPNPDNSNVVYTAQYNGASSAQQQSTVDAFHIYYYGNVSAVGWSDRMFEQGANEQASSLLEVVFTVPSQTSYDLDVSFLGGNINILSTYLSWSLSSEQHGTIAGNPALLQPVHLSGTLFPGDTYTFKASAYAGSVIDGDGGNGGMIAALTVPEPSSFALMITALVIFLITRKRIASHTA